MSLNSKIEWTDSTVNFWVGCQKVSEGCKYCYMHRILDADGKNPSKVWKTKGAFYKALWWKEPRKIFTNSMSDFFAKEADEWRKEAWDVIRRTPQHTWMILTKRPERVGENLPEDWGEGWPNVWLGVSVESQKYWYRTEILASIPARIRFISAEPLLEELDILGEVNRHRAIDDFQWIIVGGESGNEFGNYHYRECKEEWIRKVIEDVKREAPHVAVFIKQMGTYIAKQSGHKDRHGGNWYEWPKELRIREFPLTQELNEKKVIKLFYNE